MGRWWGRMIAMAGTGGCEGPATWKSKHDHSVTARFRMIDRLTKCAPRQQGETAEGEETAKGEGGEGKAAKQVDEPELIRVAFALGGLS